MTALAALRQRHLGTQLRQSLHEQVRSSPTLSCAVPAALRQRHRLAQSHYYPLSKHSAVQVLRYSGARLVTRPVGGPAVLSLELHSPTHGTLLISFLSDTSGGDAPAAAAGAGRVAVRALPAAAAVAAGGPGPRLSAGGLVDDDVALADVEQLLERFWGLPGAAAAQ